MRGKRLVKGALLLLLFSVRVGGEPIPEGMEFQVNTYTTSYQDQPSVSVDSAGDFVVVWSSDREGAYPVPGGYALGRGVFGQRYTSAGGLQGGEFQVNTYTTYSQSEPDVAKRSDGSFVVVWTSEKEGFGGCVSERSRKGRLRQASVPLSIGIFDCLGIAARRFDSGGNAIGDEFSVNTYVVDAQSRPAIAMDGAGDFVVVWQSSYQDGSSSGIFGKRYDSSGNDLSGEFQVNSHTTSIQSRPAAARAPGGQFVVVWDSSQEAGYDFGIFGKRYDSNGNDLGGEFHVNTYTTNTQYAPAVAMDASGGFVVVWSGYKEAGGSLTEIYGQQFDSLGGAVGSEFHVNEFTTGYQSQPAISMDASGGFVISWSGPRAADFGYGVSARTFNSQATPVSAEFSVNTYTTEDWVADSDPAMAPNGDFVVAWTSEGARVPTATPPPLPTNTPTETPTPDPGSPSNTPTETPTGTETPVPGTPTDTPTDTQTPIIGQDGDGNGVFAQRFGNVTLTPTPTSTPTLTATSTSTATPTLTATSTSTATPTLTATSTFTATPTLTETFTATPTLTETFTATPTLTETSTITATVTSTPGPLCSRADTCFFFELLTADFSTPGSAVFTWRLTNSCADALTRVDFRFVPGASVTDPPEASTYTSQGGRDYTVDVISGGPHGGVAFVTQSNPLPNGQSDTFSFTVLRSDLQDSTVLWNNATTGASTGRIDLRSDLCYTLPASAAPKTLGQRFPSTALLALLAAGFAAGLVLTRLRRRSAG